MKKILLLIASSVLLFCMLSNAQPNLAPCTPSNWPEAIVISTTPDSTIEPAELTTDNELFVSWAAINSGSEEVHSTFVTKFYIDGNLISSWTPDGLKAGQMAWVRNYKIDPLEPGRHKLTLTVDADNTVSETSKEDNSYSRNISIRSVSSPSEKTAKFVGGSVLSYIIVELFKALCGF